MKSNRLNRGNHHLKHNQLAKKINVKCVQIKWYTEEVKQKSSLTSGYAIGEMSYSLEKIIHKIRQ